MQKMIEKKERGGITSPRSSGSAYYDDLMVLISPLIFRIYRYIILRDDQYLPQVTYPT